MIVTRVGLAIVLSFALASCRVPPEDELDAAQKQIESARRSQAGEYAPETMREAEELLRDASAKVSERSYPEARDKALEARQKAEEAEKAALQNRAALRQTSSAFVTSLTSQVEELRARMDVLPKMRAAAASRLAMQLEDLRGLVQTYQDNVAAEHLSEAQTLVPTLQSKLRELSAAIDEAAAGTPSIPAR